MPGPGKKPTKLKILTNTLRKDRLPENVIDLPLVDDIPQPPRWLPNIHAKREFERLAKILRANEILTEGGLMALAHLAALHGKLVQLWSAGETPTGHLISQYRSMVNDFGLTPVWQGKVNIKSKKGENKFSKLNKSNG